MLRFITHISFRVSLFLDGWLTEWEVKENASHFGMYTNQFILSLRFYYSPVDISRVWSKKRRRKKRERGEFTQQCVSEPKRWEMSIDSINAALPPLDNNEFNRVGPLVILICMDGLWEERYKKKENKGLRCWMTKWYHLQCPSLLHLSGFL